MRYIVGMAAIAAISVAFAAQAETSRLQNDFTFKRVTVPSGSTARRITVQIAPAPPSAPSAPTTAGTGTSAGRGVGGPDAAPRLTGLEWFWMGVSPDLGSAGPARLQAAMKQITSPPDGKSVPTPRMQTMQEIAAAHGQQILGATIGTSVSPALVLSVIAIESAGRSDAASGAGAQGLMQLMPATAARFGVTNSLDAGQNIKGGVAYLDWLLKHFNGDPILALAGYNAGEGAVRDNNGVPPYAETRAYVPKVLAAWTVARGLCRTPPELMSDGCVFLVSDG